MVFILKNKLLKYYMVLGLLGMAAAPSPTLADTGEQNGMGQIKSSLSCVAGANAEIVDSMFTAAPSGVNAECQSIFLETYRKMQKEQEKKLKLERHQAEVIEQGLWANGYITGPVQANTQPEESAALMDGAYFYNHEPVLYFEYDTDWYGIAYNDGVVYLKKECITGEAPGYTGYSVPANAIKSYMDFRKITSKASPQYKLQMEAYSGRYGIRQVNGRYCVAVGSAFVTDIGTEIDLVLENGAVIPCILADQKANAHTDGRNMITVGDGSAAEFVVDTDMLDGTTKRYGDIGRCCEDWNSMIVEIRVYP